MASKWHVFVVFGGFKDPKTGENFIIVQENEELEEAFRENLKLKAEIAAAKTEYEVAWDICPGETLPMLMKTAVGEAKFQRDRFKKRGGDLDSHSDLLREVRTRVSEYDLCSWCGCYEPDTVRKGPRKMFHTPWCLVSRIDAKVPSDD